MALQICAYDRCDRFTWSRSLCKSHYMQQWRGEELHPLRPRRIEAPKGYAFCTTCENIKKVGEFYYRNGKPISKCKRCFIEKQTIINNRRKEAA